MSEVAKFPAAKARRLAAQQRVARYLRELADVIEKDEAETEPTAALIVLTGTSQHEVLSIGFGADATGLTEAAEVAVHCTRPYPTRGRNIRRRYAYRAPPLTGGDVVDGAFPKKQQDSSDA